MTRAATLCVAIALSMALSCRATRPDDARAAPVNLTLSYPDIGDLLADSRYLALELALPAEYVRAVYEFKRATFIRADDARKVTLALAREHSLPCREDAAAGVQPAAGGLLATCRSHEGNLYVRHVIYVGDGQLACTVRELHDMSPRARSDGAAVCASLAYRPCRVELSQDARWFEICGDEVRETREHPQVFYPAWEERQRRAQQRARR